MKKLSVVLMAIGMFALATSEALSNSKSGAGKTHTNGAQPGSGASGNGSANKGSSSGSSSGTSTPGHTSTNSVSTGHVGQVIKTGPVLTDKTLHVDVFKQVDAFKKDHIKIEPVKIDNTIKPLVIKNNATTSDVIKLNKLKPALVNHNQHHNHKHKHKHRPIVVVQLGGWYGCYEGWWRPVWYPACFPPIYVGEGTEMEEIADAIDTSSAEESAEKSYQVERFLTVKNNTNEEVRYYLLLHTLDEDGKTWTWEPEAPGQPKNVISFVLKPGEEVQVGDDDDLYTANKIRIWAKSKTREWTQYQNADLWLVELDAAGERRYDAEEMETYLFQFPER